MEAPGNGLLLTSIFHRTLCYLITRCFVKLSRCLTLSTFIASIRDFVDPHTDDATLKQWIGIEDFGGNFSFTSSPRPDIVASVVAVIGL